MRWQSAERVTAAIVAAALLLVASGGHAAPSPLPAIKSTLPGFELRYPPGWHAALRSDHGVVISTFKVVRPDSFSVRPRGSAYIVIFDYGHMPRPLPPRPTHLRLPPIRSYEGFGSGSMLNFRQAGHNFQVFVASGQGASVAHERLALQALKTLRTTAAPLANDEKTVVLGHSVQGRPIRAVHLGDFRSRRTILVIGCIHGTECAGMAVTLQLINIAATRANLWVIQDLNPDGLHAGTRVNGDGVDSTATSPG
jgi:hypothetical protein